MSAGLAQGQDEGLDQEEMEELQGLLQAAVKPEPDPFADLDDFLAGVEAKAAEDKSIKASREFLKKGGLTQEQRRETEAKIREWEARRVWQTVANVGIWDQHVCENCGHTHRMYSHVMAKQVHRTTGSPRMVMVEDWDETLPYLVGLQKSTTPLCIDCIEEFGMSFDTVEVTWDA